MVKKISSDMKRVFTIFTTNARKCKYANLTQFNIQYIPCNSVLKIATKQHMLGLNIFVRVQTFRQRPFAPLHNFCHPVELHGLRINHQVKSLDYNRELRDCNLKFKLTSRSKTLTICPEHIWQGEDIEDTHIEDRVLTSYLNSKFGGENTLNSIKRGTFTKM